MGTIIRLFLLLLLCMAVHSHRGSDASWLLLGGHQFQTECRFPAPSVSTLGLEGRSATESLGQPVSGKGSELADSHGDREKGGRVLETAAATEGPEALVVLNSEVLTLEGDIHAGLSLEQKGVILDLALSSDGKSVYSLQFKHVDMSSPPGADGGGSLGAYEDLCQLRTTGNLNGLAVFPSRRASTKSGGADVPSAASSAAAAAEPDAVASTGGGEEGTDLVLVNGYMDGKGGNMWSLDPRRADVECSESQFLLANLPEPESMTVDRSQVVPGQEEEEEDLEEEEEEKVVGSNEGRWIYVVTQRSRILKIWHRASLMARTRLPCSSISLGSGSPPSPSSVLFDKPRIGFSSIAGDGRFLFVADRGNGRVRRVDTRTGATQTVAIFGESEEVMITDGNPAAVAVTRDGLHLFVITKLSRADTRAEIQWVRLGIDGVPEGRFTTVAYLANTMESLLSIAISDDSGHLYAGDNRGRVHKFKLNSSAVPPPNSSDVEGSVDLRNRRSHYSGALTVVVTSRIVVCVAAMIVIVLEKLREANFKINAKKCEWAKTQVLYLGHVLDGDGIKPEDSKIAAIRDWPTPRTLTELRSFLGLANYYRKFVRNFSTIAAPLRRLLKKEAIWQWDKDCTSALKKLKRALIEYPVLKVADPSLPFVVTTDASQYGIGAVLQQDDDNGYRPVELMSARMPCEKVATSTHERELYALRQALDHWKHYLLGRHFKVYSDHETLRWLKTQAKMTPKLTRWAAEIDQFDFELKPVKGKYNVVADALSRRSDYFGAVERRMQFG
ncbi:hypothetical protein CBR_g28025 [Chara braunii]|uniref:Reverse transcriptase RNase H-like domain-containing protein n=1 Tax=Chara braunii TaxID=69332 RepID=A0A388L991_CHABU|nr:hypothetical protein CBR_g28025 [Chara braunii]|eukprot:GBG78802.1 hypothetical protein CBR_g28025 [Chara braunii]